jgi:hypothetical protein
MTMPTMTWTRLARALGSDHNPLRRRSDLIAAWLTPAAIAIFLVLGPLAAGGAMMWVHASNDAARGAARQLHQVPAVLLQPVPGPLESDGGANDWLTWTPARWTAAGQQHVGEVPALSGTPAGATVLAWLDRAGHVRIPPMTAAQAADRVRAAAGMALSILAGLLIVAGVAGHGILNRRRLAAWEAEWGLVDPSWNPPGWNPPGWNPPGC